MSFLRSCKIYFSWLFSALFLIPVPGICGILFPQQQSKYIFGKITVENGLSSNEVNAVLQDKSGLLWFGTENGLSRFDGYDFRIYREDAHELNTISDNSIWSIFEDHTGIIWLGTKSGELNSYDPATEQFKHWELPSGSIKENSVTCIYGDRGNNSLWIGTYKYGLFRFDPELNKFEHWYHTADDPKSLSNNYVTSICQDAAGNIWVGTYKGLNRIIFSSSGISFRQYFSIPGDNNSLSSNLIWSLTKSSSNPGIIWIGTLNGLTEFNPLQVSFSRIKLPPEKKFGLSSSISSIVEDSVGNEKVLWIGTYGGLLRVNLSSGLSERFVQDINNAAGITGNRVNFLYKDRSDVVWVGTTNGLNYFSHKRVKFNYLFQISEEIPGLHKLLNRNIEAVVQSEDKTIWIGTNQGLYYLKDIESYPTVFKFEALGNTHIWSLEVDRKNKLWVGTYGNGIKSIDLNTQKLINMNLSGYYSPISSYNFIRSILADSKDRLWMGFWGAGLACMNLSSGEINFYRYENNNPNSLSYNDVGNIYEDSKGRIWIGTWGGGLNLFDEVRNHFIRWETGRDSSFGTIGNNVNYIFEASRDKSSKENKTVLWIGTRDGLGKLVVKKDDGSYSIEAGNLEFTNYMINDGLPDNSIEIIAEDRSGNLWLGTGSGMSRLNINNNIFTNYSTSDGLSGNIFNAGSALRTKGGLILFGSTDGLSIFDPESINRSSYSPSVVITEFNIFNKPVYAGKTSALHTNIITAKEIKPSFDQNVFSFKFSALDYNSPKSIQYAYKMEGFDKDWIYSGNRRFVTYTNLYPGNYTFIVKATNSDGVWSKHSASLKVIITSPWWRTDWAYVLYVTLIISGLLAIRRFDKNRKMLRKELKMHEFEAKKQKEIENMKSRFFANLSHEFRTPLMLIKGPLEQLLKRSSGTGSEKQYKMIYRNAEKLHNLIDQLLELTQLEASAIPLKAMKENIIILLRGTVYSFDALAKWKNIRLTFTANEERINTWVDRDKLEKIMNNLISNAIKFTPSEGHITITAEKIKSADKEYMTIKVSDSGIGISQDKLDKIFNRFYQADDSSRKAYGGSGIGLSLVKELVELHKWEISVKSAEKKGTEFTVTVPLYDNYLSNKEKIGERKNDETPNRFNDKKYGKRKLYDIDTDRVDLHENKHSNNQRPSILIVEDSGDVRIYLSDILQRDYNIHHAKSCDEGIAAAAENTIDLIISDIMMPGTNGIEFCRNIKNNWETSHIPLIFLTAKASAKSKIEGLETGADDYLTKPFNSEELIVRIKNLLRQRKLLRERFAKDYNNNKRMSMYSSLDNAFLQKVLKIAEKNLDNSGFDSESFAREMFVSRSQFHRKLTALTGQAPGEFLRTVRLKKAAQLVLEKKLSITQIAFSVGFNSPSHFSKAFRQYFRCLPSEFAAKQKT